MFWETKFLKLLELLRQHDLGEPAPPPPNRPVPQYPDVRPHCRLLSACSPSLSPNPNPAARPAPTLDGCLAHSLSQPSLPCSLPLKPPTPSPLPSRSLVTAGLSSPTLITGSQHCALGPKLTLAPRAAAGTQAGAPARHPVNGTFSGSGGSGKPRSTPGTRTRGARSSPARQQWSRHQALDQQSSSFNDFNAGSSFISGTTTVVASPSFRSAIKASTDIQMQTCWLHMPVPPLHSVPLSVALQQHPVEGTATQQFVHNVPVDKSNTNNRFQESSVSTGPSDGSKTFPNAAASQYRDELGLVEQPSSTSSSSQTVQPSFGQAGVISNEVSTSAKVMVRATTSKVNPGIAAAVANNTSGPQVTSMPSKTHQSSSSSDQQYQHPVNN